MKPAHVAGMGFWAPGLRGARALVDESRVADAIEPPCELLPSRLARRASLLTRMMLEVAWQAGHEACIDLAEVPTVFATARGELGTMQLLLEMLHDGAGELSPTRFHNSVYNAAGGYFSIATGNRRLSTTLAAGDQTVALALLEAFCLLGEGHSTVLVVIADEPLSLPFLREDAAEPLASAVCLTAERPAHELGLLSMPRRATVPELPALPVAYRSNPAGPSVPLVRALQQGSYGEVPLVSGPRGWIIDVLPPSASS